MSQKLGQLGLDYMFSMDGRKVRRFPRFAAVEISPDQYRFKIDSQHLPRDVSELDITKDEVIRGLECTIGKTVQYDLSEGGLWILVDRMSGLRNIPRLVDYSNTINLMTSKDGLLVVPLGLGENRKSVKIDFQNETTAHFLVGGTTGAGKTNTVHAMICTLIQRNPHEVRLILVDLKQIEFTQYNGIPHLERPIVTEPSDVLPLVKEIWIEVQRRMALLRDTRGINHIREYNWLHRPSERLPYIIVVVDELAVIMLDRTLKHKAEIESFLARIASVGRASGIHLVLATQRPDKNVLTPLITANFPARIGLACASVYDSMTVIGNGDACFKESVPPGRAIISYGRHRMPFQVAYIRDSMRRKFINDALEGKVGSQKMFHDVTMDELALYTLAYFGGEFKKQRLFEQFVDRGMSYPEINDLGERYLCSEPGLCPGPDKCEHKQFLMDNQPYCTKQKTRGTRQPIHVVNCTEFYMLSQHDRSNVISPTDKADSQRSEVRGILQKGKGIDNQNEHTEQGGQDVHQNVLQQTERKNKLERAKRARDAMQAKIQQRLTLELEFYHTNRFANKTDLMKQFHIGRHAAIDDQMKLEQSGLHRNGNGWEHPSWDIDPIEQEQSEESEDPDAEYEDFQRRANQLLEGQDVETTEEEHF